VATTLTQPRLNLYALFIGQPTLWVMLSSPFVLFMVIGSRLETMISFPMVASELVVHIACIIPEMTLCMEIIYYNAYVYRYDYKVGASIL